MIKLKLTLIISIFSINIILAQDVDTFVNKLQQACEQKDQELLASLFLNETENQVKLAKLQAHNMLNQPSFVTFVANGTGKYGKDEFNKGLGEIGSMAIAMWRVLPPICDSNTTIERKETGDRVELSFENINYDGISKLTLVKKTNGYLIDAKWKKDDYSDVLTLSEQCSQILKEGEYLLKKNASLTEFTEKMSEHEKILQMAFKN